MDDELVRRDREYRSDEEMVLPALFGQMRELGKEAATIHADLRAADSKAANSDAEKMRRDEIATKAKYKKLELYRFQVEVQKRLSVAFSAFFFVLFGAPVGLLLRRGGIGTGFIVGLGFFALYYVLLLAGQNLADAGRVTPFLGMWLPNLILVVPVLELFSRAFFERSLLRLGR